MITARQGILTEADSLNDFLHGVTAGIEHFNSHNEEAIDYIATNLAYTKEDAQRWIKTVEFVKDATVVDKSMIGDTLKTLKQSGAASTNDVDEHSMIWEA